MMTRKSENKNIISFFWVINLIVFLGINCYVFVYFYIHPNAWSFFYILTVLIYSIPPILLTYLFNKSQKPLYIILFFLIQLLTSITLLLFYDYQCLFISFFILTYWFSMNYFKEKTMIINLYVFIEFLVAIILLTYAPS